MEDNSHNDHFVKFPYRPAVRENGDINNGGIDLIKEPHRINEIHELEGAAWLKEFIEETNKPDKLFMTLGCVWGQEDGKPIFGYVDFSLRPEAPAKLRSLLHQLDEDFYRYLHNAMVSAQAENPSEATQYARNCLAWELTPLEIYGQTYQKVTLVFRSPNHEIAAWIWGHLNYFLNAYYNSQDIETQP